MKISKKNSTPSAQRSSEKEYKLRFIVIVSGIIDLLKGPVAADMIYLVLKEPQQIGFVLHKKVILNLSKILIFGLRIGFGLGKIGFVWVRFGFVLQL